MKIILASKSGVRKRILEENNIKCKIVHSNVDEDQAKESLLNEGANPEIISKSSNTSVYEEGCLSLPGYFAEIERPAECQIEYIDYHGKKKEMKASGLLATCIQHEVDHLNGILFIDYLSKLKRDMVIKKLIKNKKELNKIVL